MRMIKDLLLWMYWHPVRSLVRLLPVRRAYGIARVLGALLFLLARKKRTQFEREYQEVFGPLDPVRDGDIHTVVKGAFALWQQNEFEVLLFPDMNPGNIDSFVRYQGMNHLDAALSRGKGVMLLFAHFGANQMIMPAVGYKGYTMSQLSAPPTVWMEKLPNKKFSAMDRKALEIRWRQELSLPVKHINIFGSLKQAFVALKNNELLGVAIDGGGGIKKTEVNFLGKKALFPTGAIELAMRTECIVLPVFMIRGNDGRSTMVIDAPLELEQGPGADRVRKNVALFVDCFEPYVLKYPGHYLAFLALRSFMTTQGDMPFLSTDER